MSLPRVRRRESGRQKSRLCTLRQAIRCHATMKVSERWRIRSSARLPHRDEAISKGGIHDDAKHNLHRNRGSVHRRVGGAARCQAVLRARCTRSGTRILARGDYRGRKNDLAGRAAASLPPVADFEAQVRDVFASIDKTLKAQGGNLKDMVTMTVFITDARNGDRFVAIRKEIFKECFPASALITVSGLAVPGLLVEVQGIAVIGGK